MQKSCAHCHAANNDDALFCRACGKPFPAQVVPPAGGTACVRCGTLNRPGAKFCKGCGTPLLALGGAAAQAQPQPATPSPGPSSTPSPTPTPAAAAVVPPSGIASPTSTRAPQERAPAALPVRQSFMVAGIVVAIALMASFWWVVQPAKDGAPAAAVTDTATTGTPSRPGGTPPTPTPTPTDVAAPAVVPDAASGATTATATAPPTLAAEQDVVETPATTAPAKPAAPAAIAKDAPVKPRPAPKPPRRSEARAPADAPAPARAPAASPAPASNDPAAACAGFPAIARSACINTTCMSPRYKPHANCATAREMQRLNEERARNGDAP